MNKIKALEEVVELVHDGDTITWSGCIGILNPERVLGALEAKFLTEGHPRDLTLFEPCSTVVSIGMEHFAYEGFIKRLITAHLGIDLEPDHCRLVVDNKVEAYAIPLGVANQLLVEIAKKSPGLLTKVGLNSYLDPRVQGGKYNDVTTGDLIRLVQFEGEEWLLFKTFPINVAIIRGTTADEYGNVSLEEEPLTLSVLYQAMAAKNWGGKVIVQVKKVVPSGSLDPRMVVVPGAMVDAVVVVEDQWQHERFPGEYDPGVDGRKRVAPPPAPLYPLDAEKVVARRAAMEIGMGQVVNFGAGIPTRRLAVFTLEEGMQDLFTVSREHGALGGISYGRDMHVNPTSWLSYQDIFNWYTGGGLNLSFSGFGQVDSQGDVNLTRFSRDVLRGPGGAADIIHHAKKVVFTGTFTQGGLRIKIDQGARRLTILQEGRNLKFVNRLFHLTVSGKHLCGQNKPVLFITERAVFRLTDGGLELIEIAPGIDLERDVLQNMEFKPLVSEHLKQMDPRVFTQEKMGLRRDMLGRDDQAPVPAVPMVPSDKLAERSYWTSRTIKR
ncbi:MAG: hypothetical protein HYX90_01460 [Chloroflexi bacterium]|nr:hypothetical protein [Chloroflexota bacterium]